MPFPLQPAAPALARAPLPGAELLDLLQIATNGVFPGAALEALIARLEVQR